MRTVGSIRECSAGMRCTMSTEEREALARSRKIDQEIKEAALRAKRDVKLLLLGEVALLDVTLLLLRSCYVTSILSLLIHTTDKEPK